MIEILVFYITIGATFGLLKMQPITSCLNSCIRRFLALISKQQIPKTVQVLPESQSVRFMNIFCNEKTMKEVLCMKRKNIDAMREVRLWIGQVIVPGVITFGAVMQIPQVRDSVVNASMKAKDKVAEAKDNIVHKFKKES